MAWCGKGTGTGQSAGLGTRQRAAAQEANSTQRETNTQQNKNPGIMLVWVRLLKYTNHGNKSRPPALGRQYNPGTSHVHVATCHTGTTSCSKVPAQITIGLKSFYTRTHPHTEHLQPALHRVEENPCKCWRGATEQPRESSLARIRRSTCGVMGLSTSISPAIDFRPRRHPPRAAKTSPSAGIVSDVCTTLYMRGSASPPLPLGCD